MVVFGTSKTGGGSAAAKLVPLFEQPLDRLLDLQAIRELNEIRAQQEERQISRLVSSSSLQLQQQLQQSHQQTAPQSGVCRPVRLCQSLSAPLTSSLSTWAKLSKENNPLKRKRAAARLRRLTLDANNNEQQVHQVHQVHEQAHQTQQQVQQTHEPTRWDSDARQTRATSPHCCPAGRLGQAPAELEQQQERCRQLLLASLPAPIKHLLIELYRKGPSTVGIFRKSPNAKHCRELRAKLEQLFEQQQRLTACGKVANLGRPISSQTVSGQSPAELQTGGRPQTVAQSTNSPILMEHNKPKEKNNEATSPQANHPEQQQQQDALADAIKSTVEQFQVNVVASVFKVSLRSAREARKAAGTVAKFPSPILRHSLPSNSSHFIPPRPPFLGLQDCLRTVLDALETV